MENGFFEDVFPIENWYIIFIAMLAYWRASLGGVPKMWFTVEQKQSLHVYEGNPVNLHYPLVRVFWQHAMYQHVCKFESFSGTQSLS